MTRNKASLGILRPVLAAFLALSLTACAGNAPASRNIEQPTALPLAGSDMPMGQARYDIQGFSVIVPPALKVSEANTYFPFADIVWRGEARGDRHAQVKAIYQEALGRATGAMHKGRPATVSVEITRFHALTEKARYTIGGSHGMEFILTLRDAKTGEIIDGPREVNGSMKASGGEKAIAEDAAGLTQRVLIVEHLARVFASELTAAPGAAKPARRSLMSFIPGIGGSKG